MSEQQPTLTGIHLFVRDMQATLAFYRKLGLTFEADSEGSFASADMPGGASIQLGTWELTRSYDPHWQEPSGAAPNTLNFSLASSQAVDDLYREMTAAGYRGHLAPIDAFWRSRYAIIDDPDGNIVSLHGPRAS
jgi:catechol 2,3-dioxygenase-like lactoylglutathione lyase family enzyme